MRRKKKSNSGISISIDFSGSKKRSSSKKFTRSMLKIIAVFFGLSIVLSMIDYVSKNGIPTEIMLFTFIVLTLSAGFFGIKRYKRINDLRRVKASGIDEIDKMTGEEFEIFLEVFFRDSTYYVERTALTGDFGADLIIKKDGKSVAVQAKRYNDKVGLTAIQEVVAAMSYYKCSNGMVITNNYFTPQAITLADSNNIELWDRDKLVHEIVKSTLTNK